MQPLVRPLVSPLAITLTEARSGGTVTPPTGSNANAQLVLNRTKKTGFTFFYGAM